MTFNRKQIVLLLCDIVLIQVSLFASFLLRFEGTFPKNFTRLIWPVIIFITLFKIGSFLAVNLYKKMWRYANVSELLAIVKGVSLSTVLTIGYVFFSRFTFPRSIILLDWMTTIFLISASRFLLRMYKEHREQIVTDLNPGKRILIIGAGDAGEMVLKEFTRHKAPNIKIVGFIDDDPTKLGLEIHGIRVLGDRDRIVSIIERHMVNEVVIAIPSASGKIIREIHKLCSKNNVKIRILPSIYELINGDVSLNQIRNVEVEDLLGREPVRIDMHEVAAYLTNKTILITGGGGSIGSEICRQVAKFTPEKLIIFDISENNIYDLEFELRERFKELNIVSIVGSIRDLERLENVFKSHRPHVVFHAAAHKHVPLMEYNSEEAIKNNIFGTLKVAMTASKYKVERFVMISTDKAVNPTNIMGASKRVAEMIIQDMSKKSETKFVAVRFGNVLGSRGSVIPLFKKQIAMGGPLTVTHPDITRFFMTIPEASQLVIQAGALGQGGEVFVLDMGKPVKIMDLARDLIELSGLKIGEDIDIKITGLRPGEKLYEELLSDKENTLATKHERILVAKLDEVDTDLLYQSLKQMEEALKSNIPKHLVATLVKLVATFKPSDLHTDVDSVKKDII